MKREWDFCIFSRIALIRRWARREGFPISGINCHYCLVTAPEVQSTLSFSFVVVVLGPVALVRGMESTPIISFLSYLIAVNCTLSDTCSP